MKRAVFIDRDGTLNEEVRYLSHADKFVLIPGSDNAIRLLNHHGVLAVLTTNQAGIARGLFTEDDLEKIHRRMGELLTERGAQLDGIYICPHHPEMMHPLYGMECDCRKPKPGLIRRAGRELGIDLASSYSVGDRMIDVEAGKGAGCKSLLVLTGYGAEEVRAHASWKLEPDYIAPNLYDAVIWILEDMGIRVWGDGNSMRKKSPDG